MYVCYWGKCLLNGAKEVYYYYPNFILKYMTSSFDFSNFSTSQNFPPYFFAFLQDHSHNCVSVSHTQTITVQFPVHPHYHQFSED